MSALAKAEDHRSQCDLLQAISAAGDTAVWNWKPDAGPVKIVCLLGNFPALPAEVEWRNICDRDGYARLLAEFRKLIQRQEKRFSIYTKLTIGAEKNEFVVSGRLVSSNGRGLEFSGIIHSPSGALAAIRKMPEESRFLANMSHELRTPIHGILGIVELALDSSPSQELASYLKSIRSASSVLLCIVNDVLDFSQLEAGRAELVVEPFNIRTLVREVLDIFAIQVARKGVEFLCEVVPTVPKYVLGDMQRIRQVLMNLIGNAVKFTNQGEVALHLSGGIEPDGSYVLKISVRDTGIGIPARKIGEIFEPFVQVDPSTARKYGGTGLGLALAKKMLQQMGGGVDVRSIEGRGSVFSITIPLPIANVDEGNASCNPTCSFPKVGLKIKSSRLLGIVQRTLLHAGYVAVDCSAIAPNDIALRSIDVWIIDASFVDLRYQGSEQAPCILLSNSLRGGSDETLVKKFALGGHLRFPFTDVELFEAVAEAGKSANEISLTGQKFTPDLNLIEAELAPEQPKKRLLIVDDDTLNLQVLHAALTRAGYFVEIAENGEVALDKFEDGTYDLVIMDIQMPVMDGIATTEAIRLREQRRSWVAIGRPLFTPIIGYTADTRNSVITAAHDAGMNDVFIKGMPRSALIEKIAQAIQRDDY